MLNSVELFLSYSHTVCVFIYVFRSSFKTGDLGNMVNRTLFNFSEEK